MWESDNRKEMFVLGPAFLGIMNSKTSVGEETGAPVVTPASVSVRHLSCGREDRGRALGSADGIR